MAYTFATILTLRFTLLGGAEVIGGFSMKTQGIKKENRVGFIILVPFLIGFLSFYIFPFLVSISYTFTSGTGLGGNYVGFRNYVSVFGSAAFILAVKNTFRFLALGLPIIIILSFIIASLLFNAFRGSKFFRSVFLFPLVVPIGAIVMFVQVFFADSGVLNTLLASLGVTVDSSWLFGERAFWVLILLYVWKNCGYNIILFLAGFNYIPKSMYESASVHGASKLQILRFITLPMMRNSFFFVFVISIINIFKSFREAYLIGGSLPHESIYMLQHFMSNNFKNLNYQRLSIASFIVFSIIFILVFFLYRSWRKTGVSL